MYPSKGNVPKYEKKVIRHYLPLIPIAIVVDSHCKIKVVEPVRIWTPIKYRYVVLPV